MKGTKQRICLIEPFHSHEEVLSPLIELLHEDFDVHVIAPQSLFEVDLLARTKHFYTPVSLRRNRNGSLVERLLKRPSEYREIRRLVDSIDPVCVLFNSTYGAFDLLMIASCFKGIRKAQIIHNFQIFLKPGMRWIYDQFDLNLVISEEVQQYVVAHHPEYRSLDYVLPIFFEDFGSVCLAEGESIQEMTSILELSVIGSVDKSRRNHQGLLDRLAVWNNESRSPQFHLNLIGKVPAEERDFIISHKLAPVIRYYEKFVTFEEMFRVLRNSDIVLFLIDSTVKDCAIYNRYKISGSSTMIKCFKKVSASSHDFKVDGLLADKCIYYPGDHVEKLFEAIERGDIDKSKIRRMEAGFDSLRIFSREEQKRRLLAALNRIKRQPKQDGKAAE